VRYQHLGLSHVIGTLLDQRFVAPPTSTHNIACKPLPYVSASLGLLTLDEAERQALIAAVAEARADPRPSIPHEEVRAEILAEIEELERQIAASSAV